jgi:hypothetical protein
VYKGEDRKLEKDYVSWKQNIEPCYARSGYLFKLIIGNVNSLSLLINWLRIIY